MFQIGGKMMAIWMQLGKKTIMGESSEEKFMGSVVLDLVDLQATIQEAEVGLIADAVVTLDLHYRVIEVEVDGEDLFRVIQVVGIETMNHLILDDLHRIEVGAEVEVIILMKVGAIMKKVTTVIKTREILNPEVSRHYLQKAKFQILMNLIQDIVIAKIYPTHQVIKLHQTLI